MIPQRIEVTVYKLILQAFVVYVDMSIRFSYLLYFFMAIQTLNEEVSGLFVRSVLIEALHS